MSNREKISDEIKNMNFTIGCYNKNIDLLNQKNLDTLLKGITGDSTDVDIRLNRKSYVVEISVADQEMDFIMVSKSDYINRYGEERYL